MSQDTTTPSSPSATTTPTPAQARLQELLEAVNEARRAVEEEQRQIARAAKAQRINGKIDAQVERLQAQVNALQARMRVLEGRRLVLEPQAQEATPQEAPTAATTRTTGARGAGRSYRTDRYEFHSAFQKRFKGTGATQRSVTATCTAHHIDPADRSPQSLARCYEIMLAERTIMAAR